MDIPGGPPEFTPEYPPEFGPYGNLDGPDYVPEYPPEFGPYVPDAHYYRRREAADMEAWAASQGAYEPPGSDTGISLGIGGEPTELVEFRASGPAGQEVALEGQTAAEDPSALSSSAPEPRPGEEDEIPTDAIKDSGHSLREGKIYIGRAPDGNGTAVYRVLEPGGDLIGFSLVDPGEEPGAEVDYPYGEQRLLKISGRLTLVKLSSSQCVSDQ